MYPELPWIHECIQCIQTPGSCIYHLGCCLVRVVVVTGSTFEILGFVFFPASRESRDSTALGKSLRGAARRAAATERSTFEFTVTPKPSYVGFPT